MDWIGLTQDRDRWRTIVSAVMKLRVPWNARNFLTSCKPVSFSRRTLHHWVRQVHTLQSSLFTNTKGVTNLTSLLKLYYFIPSLKSQFLAVYKGFMSLWRQIRTLDSRNQSNVSAFLPSDITALQLQLARQESSHIHSVRTTRHDERPFKPQRGEYKSCFCLYDLI
jgi:hypothetical protein